MGREPTPVPEGATEDLGAHAATRAASRRGVANGTDLGVIASVRI